MAIDLSSRSFNITLDDDPHDTWWLHSMTPRSMLQNNYEASMSHECPAHPLPLLPLWLLHGQEKKQHPWDEMMTLTFEIGRLEDIG